jgi:radical SAM superfamily enzyme YgiQ (UPF0313 family)
MKILLIYPRWRKGLWSIFIYRMPPLGLSRLASVTPDEFEVEIIDENVTDLTFPPAELVGISSMTPAAPRAYEIADRYRAMGATVVLGGIHPSTLPDEAGRHADSVVVGEADEIWPVLLSDFKRNQLQPRYVAPQRPGLADLPKRRRPVIDRNRYVIKNFLQTGRGCPVNCNFCSVTAFNGAQMRYRALDDVVAEIAARRPTSKYFLFADDNLVANNVQAKQLFEAITPLDIRWGSQVTIKLGMDESLLKSAVKSGCRSVFIGFESIDQHSLDFCEKRFKVQKYESAIKRLHDNGVFIIGSFIFGLDTDTPDVIKRTIEFCMRNTIEMCQFSTLTPFPDTRLYTEFSQSGRITSRDWSKYDAFHVVYRPRLMTEVDLQRSVNQAYKDYYGLTPTILRTRKTWKYAGWKPALLSAKTSWDSYRFDI